MSLPRMTTRRWMVAVVVVALGCAVVKLKQRRDEFTRLADMYSQLLLAPKSIVLDINRWNEAMAAKYRRAARRPWLPVPPDPPHP